MVDTRNQYDGLAGLYLPLAAAVVVAVVIIAVAMVLRYRKRPGEERAPGATATAPRVELAYAAVLVGIVAVLLWRTLSTEARVDRVASTEAVTVDVTAAKWHWRFAYPRYGIVQQGTDTRRPTLVVPANQIIRFRLRSPDVIHAFWIPERRFKRDALPGRTTTFNLVFPDVGHVPGGGACAEFCGLHHALMRFDVVVLAPDAFLRWAEERGERT